MEKPNHLRRCISYQKLSFSLCHVSWSRVKPKFLGALLFLGWLLTLRKLFYTTKGFGDFVWLSSTVEIWKANEVIKRAEQLYSHPCCKYHECKNPSWNWGNRLTMQQNICIRIYNILLLSYHIYISLLIFKISWSWNQVHLIEVSSWESGWTMNCKSLTVWIYVFWKWNLMVIWDDHG